MSAAHHSKLEKIEAGAQVNIIEGVQINGEDQVVENKKINLPLATAARAGMVKVDDVSVEAKNGTLSVKAVDIMKLEQKDEDILILDCGLSS